MTLFRLAALLLLASCNRSPSTPAPKLTPPPKPWPTVEEPAAASGFSWRTLRHETIHARVLLPDGAQVNTTHDPNGYPLIEVVVDGETLSLQFDSGIGLLGNTLKRTPPTVYGLKVDSATVEPHNVTARYRTANDELRIRGTAPGVKCSYQAFRDPPAATLERLTAVCASLRMPAPGAWRPPTDVERSHGGMTSIPEGGWAETKKPTHPGAALRGAGFTARLYLGGLVVAGAHCPDAIEPLQKAEAPEVEATVEARQTPAGPVWVRRATEQFEGERYPASTVVWAFRSGGCCRAELIPWTTPPSAAQLDYAIALCDTFRRE